MCVGFRKTAQVAWLGLVITLSVACTRTPQSPSETLRVQLASEPVSLDPTLAEDGTALLVLGNTMEGLVGYDGAGALQMLLAESHVVSTDGRRYEFVLRPDARWSDGRPVVADDFVTAIRRALTASQGARLAGMFFRIRGAREYFAGKDTALGVREEAGKLVIDLTEPTPYFLQVLTLPIALPLRKDILDANSGRWPVDAPSTGPYRLHSRQADRVIHLSKNNSYRKPLGGFRDVELVIINDEAAALNLFDVSRVDILTRVSAAELPRLRKRPDVLRTFPFFATYYLSFNFRKPPFNDPLWRKAVAGAVRREELVGALDGGELPARSWVPPGLEGHIPYSDPGLVFAPAMEQARKLPASSRGGTLAAVYDSSARNTLVMEKVQADLKRALGLKISLSNLDWKAYLKSVQTDPPPLFRLGILAPFSDPIQILEVFTSTSPFNYLKWSNADYDRIVEQVAGLKPGPEREAKIRQAQSILVDREAIAVPLYHYVQNHAVGPRVEGFRANPFGVIRFSELKLKGR